jgi:hypothetical protein
MGQTLEDTQTAEPVVPAEAEKPVATPVDEPTEPTPTPTPDVAAEPASQT